jgi:CPA1 family monovalent cation:H+ antiporter
MRGIVSLTAAIALPLTLPNGMPLEGRNEVIFLTFVVILITLLIPGLTLPILIKKLKIPQHTERHGESENVRNQLVNVAEKNLQLLHTSGNITEKEFHFLKSYFTAQPQILEMAHESESPKQNIESARLKVIQAQRKKLIEMWQQNEIDDKQLSHLEDELDVVEIHIARAKLQ